MFENEYQLLFHGDIRNVSCTSDNRFASHDPDALLIPITVLYVLIFTMGVIGNIVTCIVIHRNKSMHNSMNYYRFNLAIADVLFLFNVLPCLIVFLWAIELSSPAARGFFKTAVAVQESSSIASVVTITFFSIERYFAVCHPLKWHTSAKDKRTFVFIGIAWLLGLPFGVFSAFWSYVVAHPILVYASCDYEERGIPGSFELTIILFFLLPFINITVLCVLISRRLKLPSRASWNDKQRQKKSKSIFKVLLAIVVAFFTCLAPFQTYRVMRVYMIRFGTPSNTVAQVFYIMKYTSRIFYLCSGAINPILYNAISKSFREAFKKTLPIKCLERYWDRKCTPPCSEPEGSNKRTQTTDSEEAL